MRDGNGGAVKGELLDHFDGRLLNPGHAIEGAWFILNEARRRGNDAALIKLGCNMLDWMWTRGWDVEHGGIFYFRDVHGKPVQEYWHDMKFWWPHNEAILATLLAHLLTGNSRYEAMHRQVHDWAYSGISQTLSTASGTATCIATAAYPCRSRATLWKGPFPPTADAANGLAMVGEFWGVRVYFLPLGGNSRCCFARLVRSSLLGEFLAIDFEGHVAFDSDEVVAFEKLASVLNIKKFPSDLSFLISFRLAD